VSNLRKETMRKLSILFVLILAGTLLAAGCGREESSSGRAAKIETAEGDPLVYLTVKYAKASSFDQTPDWAPEPDAMAPADGDMLTRWSSDYAEGEQWIYFDLGGESVVSEVIVRWERAYATDYKILVSDDAEAWREAAHVTGSAGGSVDSVFPATAARYVKVLGLERVNDSWGISIWEIEIYGPKSYNPQATVTKEAYLSKALDEEKIKEAKAQVSKNRGEVVPLSEKPFQKGIVYTSWTGDELALPASDLTLVYVKKIGFDTVAIMVPAYQEDLDSEEIFTNDTPEGDTPTIEALTHAVRTCHKLGMRVMIKPHVDPRTDEARINIRASEKWFDSFEGFTLRYARFAEEAGAELFSVGTELEATTFEAWTHRWNRLIDKVREVYKGKLTYSANWTEYKEVPFWDKLDFIGIDAYFPLADKDDPTLEELKAGWEKVADEIEGWLTRKNLTSKGVVLTEIGYPSAEGASRQPWVAISSVEDQQEQADCLEATFSVLNARSWFRGYYIWQVFPQQRWSPLGFTVRGKKAEEVIKNWAGKNQ